MAALITTMVASPDLSLKRGCESMLYGSRQMPGITSHHYEDWDQYQNEVAYQVPKKQKADVSIPSDFGNNIGWTAGPSMMDLLSTRPVALISGMSNEGIMSGDDSEDLPDQPRTQRISSHRRHQSVPLFPSGQRNIEIMPQLPKTGSDDYNEDLEDAMYFYGDLELADERLSIGEIVWQPPAPAHVALPSTFHVAEGLTEFPPPTPSSQTRHSISKYVTHDKANVEVTCRPIQQTAEWHSIKDDPIFCDLSGILRSAAPQRRFTISQAKSKRIMEPIEEEAEDRETIKRAQDALIHALNTDSRKNDRESLSFGLLETQDRTILRPEMSRATKAHMPVKPNIGHRRSQSFNPQAQTFTQRHSHSKSLVLQPAFDFRPSSRPDPGLKPRHNRARSQSPQRSIAFPLSGDQTSQQPTNEATVSQRGRSKSPQRQLKPVVPEPKSFAVDDRQEDILAQLGVTGKAQKAYATPGPALNPLSTSPSPGYSTEQENARIPLDSDVIAQSHDVRPQMFQPLQEVSANYATVHGAKKRGRSQSEDLDNNMKRPRDTSAMRFGPRVSILANSQRW